MAGVCRTLLLLALLSLAKCSRVHIDSDGGYQGIVIKIDKRVPEQYCKDILRNLKVRIYQ